jgi:four helix bundle protein
MLKTVLSLITHTQTHTDMFDFEKLEVYTKSKAFNKSVSEFLNEKKVDKITHDQLRRAAFCIMLNIAEGSGRFTKVVKRNFYVIARVSILEYVAIFNYFRDNHVISNNRIVLYSNFLLFSIFRTNILSF